MAIQTVFQLLCGAIAGGGLGFFITKLKCCTGTCHAKAAIIYSIFSGAVFGAGVVWYIIHR